MKPITLLRALAWIAFAVVAWSLNIRWGADVRLGNGPPGQFERLVVGAMLLALVAAGALSVSGRGGAPPRLWAKGVATGAAALALILALTVRSRAIADGFPQVLGGPGWAWLAAGATGALAAAAASFLLRAPAARAGGARRKKRRR
jgi:hypothetical protein